MKRDRVYRGMPGCITSVDRGKFAHFGIGHRSLEPGKDALPRVQADQQVGPTRFVGSLNDWKITHSDHEPLRLTEARSGARVCDPQHLRFMERHKEGFTLIELLVVVVILAVLAVTLLPALAGTRQNSQVIGCLSNQRQLAFAWIMYARDNNDVLVPNRGLGGAVGVNYAMDPRTQPNLQPGGANADWCPGNIQNLQSALHQDWWIEAGLLYPYLKNLNVYHCPADHSLVPHGVPSSVLHFALRTYSMNAWVQPMDSPGYQTATWLGIRGYAAYTKLGDMVKPGPAKTWVFIEENPYTIDDGFFALDPRETTTWANLPAVLHGNASVLAYADGHSDAHRWTDSRMMTATPPSPISNVDNWPADPNSGDLPWLISASTAPQ